MSLQANLILLALGVSAYTGWLITEEVKNSWVRKNRTAVGEFILARVQIHFSKLRSKRAAQIVDKGYGVVDDSAWQSEIARFIRACLSKADQDMKLKIEAQANKLFVNELIMLLCKDEKIPEGFSVKEFAKSFPDVQSKSGALAYVASWGFSALLAALGIKAFVDGSWLTGLIALIAGAVFNPLLVKKASEKKPILGRFFLSFIVGSVLTVLAALAQSAHVAKIDAEVQRQQALVKQQQAVELARKQEERRKALAEKQALEKQQLEAEQQALRKEFAQNKDKILKEISGHIGSVHMYQARALIDKYAFIGDPGISQAEEAFKAKKEEERKRNEYEAKIPADVLSPYTKAGYPKAFRMFGKRMPEIEKLRRKAAEQVVDSGKCDKIELIEISQDRSSPKNVVFFTDCQNGQRIYRTEAEVKQAASVSTLAESAWSMEDAYIECRQMVLDNATIPSSVDFHILGTDKQIFPATGNVQVLMDFDAQNAYGTEIGYTARCVFPPKKQGELEIFLRR